MFGMLRAAASVFIASGLATGSLGVFVPDPAVDAVMSRDGAIQFSLTVINPSSSSAVIAVETASPVCKSVDTPVIEPGKSADLNIRLSGCKLEPGVATASLSTTLVSADGATTVMPPIALELTVKAAPSAPWSKLGWFAIGLAALFAILPPYLTWVAFPQGNSDMRAKFTWRDLRKIVGSLRSGVWLRRLFEDLPGITKDWSFTDSWASNVGLGASLFTGVFAVANPVGGMLTDATSTLMVLTVAAAISAAVIASGPLWLTILKRRTQQNQGFPRYNTIAGVLMASFVVYFATLGLIATVVALAWQLVPTLLLLGLATAAWLLLMAYSWKSIPQTLGLGKYPQPAQRGWLVERTPDADSLYRIREVDIEQSRPASRTTTESDWQSHRPRAGRSDVAAMQ